MNGSFIFLNVCGTAVNYNVVSFRLESRRDNIVGEVVVLYINCNSRFNLSSEFLSFTSLARGQPK
jgi:hypothetical protein